MLKYDVVVVGGGPIGGFVTGKIAEKKYSVAVFEKNKQIGLPINCAGLVTPRVFEIVNTTEKETIQNGCLETNINWVMSYDPPCDPEIGINKSKTDNLPYYN